MRLAFALLASIHCSLASTIARGQSLDVSPDSTDPWPLPAELVARMDRGINLGNTLDAKYEGALAPPAQEWLFDDYVSIGFKSVRIPVTWGNHTATTPPYTIDPVWMARVEQVVGWALDRGLIAIVNSHHDTWLDSELLFPLRLPRFKAIWTQIATTFANRSSNLLFEIYNEPHVMTVEQLNRMNSEVLSIIRASNPSRTVLYGGLGRMNPKWLKANPDAMVLPSDRYVAVEVHSYDPFDYAGPFNTRHSWGTADDIASVHAWVNTTQAWAAQKGVSILYGEFGCTYHQAPATGRLDWYKVHVDVARAAGFAVAVWDDSGWFGIVNRTTGVWNTGVLTAMGLGNVTWKD